MSSRSLTWLPLALLLLVAAGAGAWLVLKRPARPNVEQDLCSGAASEQVARGGKPDAATENSPQDSGGDVAPPPGKPARESTKPGDPAKPQRGDGEKDQPERVLVEGTSQTGVAPGNPHAAELPIEGLSPGATAAVKQPTGYTALKGALEPAQWDEYWSKRGMRAPEAVATPVSGKIMSRATIKGEASATVGLIVFFAESEAVLAPLLPVIHEFTTDKDGVFSGTVNAPRRPPADNERLALYVSSGGERKIVGLPVSGFTSGVKNDLGIFWLELGKIVFHCNAKAFEGHRQVVYSGGLDPRRWSEKQRIEMLYAFPRADVDDSLDTTLAESQTNSNHIVSLLIDGVFVQTRATGYMSFNRRGTEFTVKADFSQNIVFNKSEDVLSGRIIDEQGIGLLGAIVRINIRDEQLVVSDQTGYFAFTDLPKFDKCDIFVEHADYLPERIQGVRRSESNLTIGMTRPKPRIALNVIDRDSGLPLPTFSIRVIAVDPLAPDPAKAQVLEPQVVEVHDPDGNYLLVWDAPIQSICVEKLGYMPFKYEVAKNKQRLETPLEVALAPGRKLEIRPRDYTAVGDATKWFVDPKAADGSERPGIYTAWADQTIEYEIDFGDAPPAGAAGGYFDLILGCTNHGIIDNNYLFKIDVFVDSGLKGSLNVKADSANEQTGRIALGALSGKRRVRLVWKNDAWIEGQLDANIRYASIKFLETAPK
ncbi:MAG: hypothetical protein IT462_07690 [Planctomycetes bacterium]|nr:hypothetical protein [Planctomycetota bacterium]